MRAGEPAHSHSLARSCLNFYLPVSDKMHTGQCKSTGGYYNELVVAYYGTGGGVKCGKGKQNLYLLTL